MFKIDDQRHCEFQEGEYSTLEEAIAELRRLASLEWNEHPNRAPCRSWRTCGREWAIFEFEDSISWKELSFGLYLEIDAKGVRWLKDVPDDD